MASSSSQASPPQSANVFASPWNNSDVVLIVEDKEIHVHRSILCLQSAVFKAMLCGQFTEANARFIPLPEKKHSEMLQFIQLLYPPNMIKAPKVKICDGNVFEILKLADEYEAVHVATQCLNEIKVTQSNAVPLLVYVDRYDQSLLPKFLDVTSRYISASKLGECEVGNEKITQRLLLSKCKHLESLLVETNKFGLRMLRKTRQLKTVESACGHRVSATDFHKARLCPACLETYRSEFLAYAVTSKGLLLMKAQAELEEKYFNGLEQVDDIVTSLLPAANTLNTAGTAAGTP